jgi:hypothetical protein
MWPVSRSHCALLILHGTLGTEVARPTGRSGRLLGTGDLRSPAHVCEPCGFLDPTKNEPCAKNHVTSLVRPPASQGFDELDGDHQPLACGLQRGALESKQGALAFHHI